MNWNLAVILVCWDLWICGYSSSLVSALYKPTRINIIAARCISVIIMLIKGNAIITLLCFVLSLSYVINVHVIAAIVMFLRVLICFSFKVHEINWHLKIPFLFCNVNTLQFNLDIHKLELYI